MSGHPHGRALASGHVPRAASGPDAAPGPEVAPEGLPGSGEQQLLTFRLGAEEHGVPILCVQGIQAWQPPTAVPDSAPHVLGVVNVRGAIVPVLDLRVRFGLPASAPGAKTPMVVVSGGLPQGQRWAGLVVDAMCDVRMVAPELVSCPPGLGAGGGEGVVKGIAPVGEGMVVLLDVDALLEEGLRPTGEAAAPGEGSLSNGIPPAEGAHG